jgi:hypothetical protein
LTPSRRRYPHPETGSITPTIGGSITAIRDTLVGTGVGALLAFWFERNTRRRERRDADAAALLAAQFALDMQLNSVLLLKRQAIDRFPEGSEGRLLGPMPTDIFESAPRVDLASISFMLGRRADGTSTLQDIALTQQSLNGLIGLLQQREAYLASIQRPGASAVEETNKLLREHSTQVMAEHDEQGRSETCSLVP